MVKVLILRFSSIGDIVLTTPVIRCLKLQRPDIEIHYATKKNYASILESNPYISKIHLLDKNGGNLIQALKNEHFDYIIDLHNNLRTLRIKWSLFSVKSFSFDKLNFQKWLLVNFKINQLPKIHIVDRYLKTVEKLGVVNDKKGLDYFIPKSEVIDIQGFISKSFPNFQNFELPNFVAFCIGGQHFTKKLPNNKIVEFCQKFEQPILLLGGKEDFENGEEICNLSPTKQIINLCGKLSLNHSASVLQQADLVITHDTGLMHIASALKKKIISVWGNTVPEFGMYPYLTEYQVIENQGLSCRPCSKIGYKKCPKGHFKCMNELRF